MKLTTALKLHKNFADVLATIIADLKEANTVLVPELIIMLRSIEKFTTNDKVKAVIDKIIKAIGYAQVLTPDVIVLLEDLQKILAE